METFVPLFPIPISILASSAGNTAIFAMFILFYINDLQRK